MWRVCNAPSLSHPLPLTLTQHIPAPWCPQPSPLNKLPIPPTLYLSSLRSCPSQPPQFPRPIKIRVYISPLLCQCLCILGSRPCLLILVAANMFSSLHGINTFTHSSKAGKSLECCKQLWHLPSLSPFSLTPGPPSDTLPPIRSISSFLLHTPFLRPLTPSHHNPPSSLCKISDFSRALLAPEATNFQIFRAMA